MARKRVIVFNSAKEQHTLEQVERFLNALGVPPEESEDAIALAAHVLHHKRDDRDFLAHEILTRDNEDIKNHEDIPAKIARIKAVPAPKSGERRTDQLPYVPSNPAGTLNRGTWRGIPHGINAAQPTHGKPATDNRETKRVIREVTGEMEHRIRMMSPGKRRRLARQARALKGE